MDDRPTLRWFQFSLRRMLLAMTVASLAVAAWWIWLPWWRERVLVAELRQRVLAAQSSRDAGIAYQELMPPQRTQRLRRLMDDPDTSISLKACFELLKKRDRDERMSKADVAIFADHLRKRTGLEPPDWWLAGLPDQFPDPPKSTSALMQRLPSGVTVEAKTDDDGGKFPLRCTGNGKLEWESEVWALGVNNIGAISGFWSHNAHLAIHNHWIVVWGAGTGGTYVEAFHRQTGANEFRFCSEFWYTEH